MPSPYALITTSHRRIVLSEGILRHKEIARPISWIERIGGPATGAARHSARPQWADVPPRFLPFYQNAWRNTGRVYRYVIYEFLFLSPDFICCDRELNLIYQLYRKIYAGKSENDSV